MARPTNRLSRGHGRTLAALIVAVVTLLAIVPSGSTGEAAAAESALSRWTGGVDLYRAATFTTQRSWLWCTAADVQIMRNIVHHKDNHSRAQQERFYRYMRNHNRYPIPASEGVDPAGWAAGLRRFVDDRYRLLRTDRFAPLLRTAVKALRLTNRPVALFVDHGNHGWVLHGFEASADPATHSPASTARNESRIARP